MMVWKSEGQKYKKITKKFKKCATINIRCNIKKQHSQTEESYPYLPSKPCRNEVN
jgi:hypothetical protein